MESGESKDNSSNEKSLKHYASRVFEESTIGIVSSIAQITSTKRKFFKILTLIVCLTGFLYHSGKYLSVFFQYPTSVYTEVLLPDTYNIPAYTFCDNNRINRRMFCEKFPDRCEETSLDICDKYPSYCGENRTLKPKKEYYYMSNSLRPEDITDLNKLDASYKYAYVIESPSEKITGPYFRMKDLQNAHLCYSLNDRVNKSLLPITSKSNTILKLDINELNFKVKSDEVFLPGYSAGMLFELHSPFDAVNPFQTGVFLRPGRSYIIYVSVEETIIEKSPYDTDCVNYTELWEKNGRSGPRSQEMCKHNCGVETSFLCYGCILPVYLYPTKEKYCDLTANMYLSDNCPTSESDIQEYCRKSCRKDCRQTFYRFTVQNRYEGDYYDFRGNIIKDIEDLIKVEIFLDRYEVTVHKYSTKYMNFELFSSIGGFIGIWLGVSLLDIADIFEGLFRIFRFSFRKKREIKKIALSTQ